jgi:phosphohistidine phosphatase
MTCDPKTMPTLVLLRHAKAEPHHPDDHARVLASRGRTDAAAAREWLRNKGILPERVIVSTASRTRETWELASVGSARPIYDQRVYEAEPEDLLEVLRETPEQIGTVVLVGHNPSIEVLAWQLDDSEEARDQTGRGLPTAAIAVFEVDGWWDLASGRLTELAAPR